MGDRYDWLLDLLDRARTAVEANAKLEWRSEKNRDTMLDELITTLRNKLVVGPPKPATKPRPTISCSECLMQVTVTEAGFVHYHGPHDERCPGSGRPVGTRHQPLGSKSNV